MDLKIEECLSHVIGVITKGRENEQRGKVKVPFTNCMMSKMEYAIGILF